MHVSFLLLQGKVIWALLHENTFDQNISHRLVSCLKDILPESRQIRDLDLENSTERQIWEFAKSNNYIIVTFDGDFYDFSLVWGHPPKIIWLRTLNQTAKNLEKRDHNQILGRNNLICLGT